MTRGHVRIGGLDVFEPANAAELEAIGGRLRPEEREESETLGETAEVRRRAYARCRRTATVCHKGEMLAVGAIMDMPDGRRYLTLERAEACLRPGHRVAWLRGFGPFAAWARASDDAMGFSGAFFTVSPVDYPSAIRLYCRHGGAQLRGEIEVAGRAFYLFEFPETEGGDLP